MSLSPPLRDFIVASSTVIVCVFAYLASTTYYAPESPHIAHPAALSCPEVPAKVHGADRRISDFLRLTGYIPPTAEEPSPFFKQPKHPDFDIVIDVGAYDCTDYTVAGFKAGYTVFSFELSPLNLGRCYDNFRANGLKEGKDLTVVKVTPGSVPKINLQLGKPHIYFFEAGVSNRVGGTETRDGATMTQVAAETGHIPLIQIDDVIPSNSSVYVFKSDTQGHEYGVFTGASNLLSNGKVALLALEFWPQGARENKFDCKKLLQFLYDHGFQCFDTGVHAYDHLGRPSEIFAFTDFLDNLPRSLDAIGAWEDLVCTRYQ